MRVKIVAVVIALVATAAVAEDDYPVLVYPVPRAASPPALDGQLTDACWLAAPVASGFTRYDRPELMAVQTSVRWTWDDDALYLGVACDEPEVEQLKPLPLPRDSRQVFSSEAIEAFVDAGHDHVDYVQIAANAAGAIFDGRRQDPSWNSDAEAAGAIGARGWSVELKIPWTALGVTPAPGVLLGANVCRDRTLAQREWSNWSQTKANFHDPARFGHLVLAPTPAQLVALQGELRKGDRRGPLRIFSPGGIGAATYRDMAAHLLAAVDARLTELRALRDRESGALRDALDSRLVEFEARLGPVRTDVAGSLDGGQFTRVELALTGMRVELESLLWEARLDALLSTI